MANEELLVTLGVQDKGATTQIKALNQELKSLDKQYNLASKAGDGFDSSIDGLQKKLGLLEDKMSAQTAKLQAYKKQMDTAREGVAKKTAELEKLRAEQGDNTTAIAKTEKQLNTYRNQLKQAENGVKETEAQLELLTEEIENTNKAIKNFDTKKMLDGLKEAGDTIESFGDRLDKTSQVMNDIGGKMIALSAPITAFAGYAVNAGIAFEDSMAKTGALARATAEEFELLETTAKNLGESIAGASAKDVADSFGYLALAGYDVNQMISAIEPNVKASIAWGEDMATNTDLVTDSLSSLGLKAEDTTYYLDVLTNAQNNSNTSGQQLLEAYVSVGGMFRDFNTPLAESTALLGVLANRGIKGSEAGKALNSILINLMGTTSTTEGALKKLGVSAYDADGNFRGVEATLRDVSASMKNMTQEQEDMLSAQLGGKTQIDTLKALLAGLDEEYDSLKATISDSTGALETMYQTMSGTTAGQIETFKSTLEGLGLQIADHLLPHINDLLQAGMELIKWFGSLDDETQKSIIKTGLFATATGGLLKVLSGVVSDGSKVVKFLGNFVKSAGDGEQSSNKLASSFGKAVTALGKMGIGLPAVAGAVGVLSAGVYAYNEYQDAMNTKVTTAREKMSFLERVMLDLSGATTYSRKELEDMGLVYKDFNENISKEFRDSVEAMTDDMHDFKFALMDMNLDGVFSEQDSVALMKRVDGALEGAKSAIDSKSATIQDGLKEAFAVDGVIDENEVNLLQWWQSRAEKEKEEATKLRNEINEIEQRAYAEGRALTSDEVKAIEDRYAQIQMIELQAKAKNNYEMEYAQQDFIQRMKTLDAEGAKELLQERYKQYEEEEIAIKTKYETMKALLMDGYENLNEAERESIDASLRSLEEWKTQSLEKNQKYWEEAYNKAVVENENIAGVINKFTGEELMAADRKYYDLYVKMSEAYEGFNDITKTGYYTMYDTTNDSWHNIYAVVDEKTGGLKALYDMNSGDLAAMSKKDADTLKQEYQAWRDTAEGATTEIMTIRGAYVDAENNIRNSSGNIIGSLGKVEDKAGVLKDAILGINGTPIDLGDNTDEVIEHLKSTKKEVDNLNGSTATVTVDDGGSINTLGQRIRNLFSGNAYAIGTSNAPEGIHTVNEKGWELIDAPQGKTAFALGSGFGGDTAYLPRGTKVKTNLASTQMMMQEVRAEVSRQLGRIDYSNEYYSSRSAGATAMVRSANSNSNKELVSVMNTMVGLLAELVNKDTIIQMNGKTVAKMIANDVDEQISKRARVRF